jgi:hypothetical protein
MHEIAGQYRTVLGVKLRRPIFRAKPDFCAPGVILADAPHDFPVPRAKALQKWRAGTWHDRHQSTFRTFGPTGGNVGAKATVYGEILMVPSGRISTTIPGLAALMARAMSAWVQRAGRRLIAPILPPRPASAAPRVLSIVSASMKRFWTSNPRWPRMVQKVTN